MVESQVKIGWAQTDITPAGPVLLWGQFHARLSEGVMDPISVTALALESPEDHVVLVSCEIVGIPDALRDLVRALLKGRAAGLDPLKIVMHATHTHAGPVVHLGTPAPDDFTGGPGVELPAMNVDEYSRFLAQRMADAIAAAWDGRAPGGIAYGVGTAVVGRNRRWVDAGGKSTMYGNTNTAAFSHIEGYEDHSVGVIATYDAAGTLTGALVNVPCPSQVSEQSFSISADYWCETRKEIRRRLGEKLFILPQCSAAGDQSPHLIYDKRAADRMLKLKGRTVRDEIAHRIGEAVEDVVSSLSGALESRPRLRHHAETLALPTTRLTEQDVKSALAEAEEFRATYDREMRKLADNPALRQEPRWYVAATAAHGRMRWLRSVATRFERQKTQPTLPCELHVIAIADAVMVTVPFEYYLDFGIAIKARSAATQTFLVQLAGGGTYCPSERSLVGGGYGSLPASNPVGPEGGKQLAVRAIDLIAQICQP